MCTFFEMELELEIVRDEVTFSFVPQTQKLGPLRDYCGTRYC